MATEQKNLTLKVWSHSKFFCKNYLVKSLKGLNFYDSQTQFKLSQSPS